ncbi:LysM peptidoglycan-binding domain-containing protein [Deinococcus arenicola]|uniref:LysM peptidoglycan-binding domain-containing protein n=1 Tax=Deinococcus arenicola TaxID=2994950 RepID=A0ABU4DMU1_9DEIO|nr:LysM peptidoglycan-binding domain-containing protein [Deinococcus sp. ZS9-10]MDV6373748.1 LysM peptidoglycan-binding domain-containing protein [Deinococcus sp. ZS9-10]
MPTRHFFLTFLLLTGSAFSASGTVTVRSGDTLYRIATRAGLSVAQLKAINGLKSNTIKIGQVLRLSKAAPAPAPRTPATRTPAARIPAPAPRVTYTVQRGDFLSRIAGKYGVSVGALQAANRISGTLITPGQRLTIPPRGAALSNVPTIPPNTEVRTLYTYIYMQRGETPDQIARRYRISVDKLRLLNSLNSASYLVPGIKLLVPSHVPVPIPPSPHGRAASFKQLRPLNIPVQIINVDLRHRNVLVAPVLPGRGLVFGSGARVGQLARSSGAQALINGSYFHPQSFAPAGDIVMQGRMLTWGRIPQALAITPDNRASIRPSTTGLLRAPLSSAWQGMETVIATGPRILANGQVQNRYSSAFRDPALFGRAARSAIGLVSNRDLVMVSTGSRLTITEMAKVMSQLGIRDALLLDGGSSTGLAWNGRPVLDSVRKVSYGIGVFTEYTGRRYIR